MKTYSIETLFENVVLKQNKSGYRYSIDPILVSHFAEPSPGDKVVDLGTGCGIIPIILGHRIPSLEITGVEIQFSLAALAEYNIAANNMSDFIKIIHSDMKKIGGYIKPSSIDLVISNPPYTKKNSGRINPDSEKAIARHEIEITLNELVRVVAELLKDKGVFVVVYPKKRLSEVLSVLAENGINPELLRYVCTKKNSEPKLFLLKAVKKGKRGLTIGQTVYVYDELNACIDEVAKMFQ